jgi:hypothetical protein
MLADQAFSAASVVANYKSSSQNGLSGGVKGQEIALVPSKEY